MRGTWTICLAHSNGSKTYRYTNVQPIKEGNTLTIVVEKGNYIERIKCKKYYVTITFEPAVEEEMEKA